MNHMGTPPSPSCVEQRRALNLERVNPVQYGFVWKDKLGHSDSERKQRMTEIAVGAEALSHNAERG